MISEFTQYDIGEEELDDMIDSLDEESRLYYKLKDIRLLYDGVQEEQHSGTGWIYRLYTGAEQADSGAYEIL